MTDKINFPGVIVSAGMPNENFMTALNKATRAWEIQAARGECGWVCADCCSSAPDGMPVECMHGLQWCTDIIQRDKREAAQEQGGSDV